MKIEEFKNDLQASLKKFCSEKNWSFDNAKYRGMAFENWCFDLLSDRYPATDNDPDECIIRGDDAGIDIFFECKEMGEIYILQCKHPKIRASDPIDEGELKSFFSNYELLSDRKYQNKRQTNNPKLHELNAEFPYWMKQGFLIHFVFASTGTSNEKTAALVEKFNRDNANSNVKFEIWDIGTLRDEFVAVKSIDEQYPDDVTMTLADKHFMTPEGELKNITFALRGSTLQDLAHKYKETLFNWNIRRFLGRKGEVNSGLRETLEKEPELFYYYNNGISALCDSFEFEEITKKLTIKKLQIVNGAQTLGALRYADTEKVRKALVVVKLTAIKHAAREQGIAATLIKTNNTQNTLRIPDFRSNDKIQIWLENKFKNTKPRGDLLQIVYGRKRPYPRASSSQISLKLQDLGKIRFAWYHDPRIPIADPAKLFQLPEENGLYADAFGVDGEIVDIWSDQQFRETLLAIHSYNKIDSELKKIQSENEELKQLSRLKYYGLKLFKMYIKEILPVTPNTKDEDLYLFGGKFDAFFQRAKKIIVRTLEQAYREILKREEGTAFSLPRDTKVWEQVKRKFEDNLALIRDLEPSR
jgi:hypothetical protein